MIPTQAGVTWSIEKKYTPVWEMNCSAILQALESEFANGWTDDNGRHEYHDLELLIQSSKIVIDSFDEVRNKNGCLSKFQYRSLRDLLRGSKSTGEKTQAIVAGTGCGKSYGFQLGTLISLVYDRLKSDTVLKVHTILMHSSRR